MGAFRLILRAELRRGYTGRTGSRNWISGSAGYRVRS